MKKYFTDYVIEGGPIKAGDMVLKPAIPNDCDAYIEEFGEDDLIHHSIESYKKVKLMVCSRDIQIGDKVEFQGGYNREVLSVNEDGDFVFKISDDKTGVIGKDYAYKVIGEVSPDATWVEPKMEFEEEDLFAYGVGHNWDNTSYGWKFRFKCPTCKHFH